VSINYEFQLYAVIRDIFFIYAIVMNCRKSDLELYVKLVLAIIKSAYSGYLFSKLLWVHKLALKIVEWYDNGHPIIFLYNIKLS
jgi:hypothetical protein